MGQIFLWNKESNLMGQKMPSQSKISVAIILMQKYITKRFFMFLRVLEVAEFEYEISFARYCFCGKLPDIDICWHILNISRQR